MMRLLVTSKGVNEFFFFKKKSKTTSIKKIITRFQNSLCLCLVSVIWAPHGKIHSISVPLRMEKENKTSQNNKLLRIIYGPSDSRNVPCSFDWIIANLSCSFSSSILNCFTSGVSCTAAGDLFLSSNKSASS